MDATSQAELRRKKILTNAEARLRKIKRITLQDIEKDSEKQDSGNQQELINESKAQKKDLNLLCAYPKAVKDEKCSSPSLLSDSVANELEPFTNGDLCNGLHKKSDIESAELLNHRNEIETVTDRNLKLVQNAKSTFVKSQSPERHIYLDLFVFLILGMIIRFICYIGFSSLFLDNILGPFLVVCLPRVILYMKQNTDLPMMCSLIILMGVQESRVKTPFRILSCLRTAVQYLALYLFSFFVTHSILTELKV